MKKLGMILFFLLGEIVVFSNDFDRYKFEQCLQLPEREKQDCLKDLLGDVEVIGFFDDITSGVYEASSWVNWINKLFLKSTGACIVGVKCAQQAGVTNIPGLNGTSALTNIQAMNGVTIGQNLAYIYALHELSSFYENYMIETNRNGFLNQKEKRDQLKNEVQTALLSKRNSN